MGTDIFDTLIYLIKGFSVGFMASIPLGPIGVMCIQRTLSKGHRSGIISGLGEASADLIFAIVAVFSLTLVTAFVESHMLLLKMIGGICVVVMGVYIFLKNPAVQIRKNRAGKGSFWSDFITIFFLTLTNPAFILVFVTLFAAAGVGQNPTANNLLSNVCKYAMPNTRVYLEVRAEGENAVLSVKNMSRESLNITAEELMERFVRGDASRNTEGSGLGLSIAQSLAKLMGGEVRITVDGDLFKAEVVLPMGK